MAPGATGAPPVKQNSIVSETFCDDQIERSWCPSSLRFSECLGTNLSKFGHESLSNREISDTKNSRVHLHHSEELQDTAGGYLVSVCIQKLQNSIVLGNIKINVVDFFRVSRFGGPADHSKKDNF